MTLQDEFRYAVGTFTRVQVPPPTTLDGRVAARGLAVGPVVGAAVGAVSGLPLLFGDADLVARLLSATVVVAIAAWLTRALHWDGLADVADGLGSGRPPEGALEVMRRSDIGPFAVLVLTGTAAVQVLGIAQLPSGPPAWAGWILAITAGRLAVAVGAGPWVRPARREGLGSLVIGAVSARMLAVALSLTLVVGAVQALNDYLAWPVALLWAPGASIVVAVVLARVAARRFGGSTGDVLGATAELAAAAALLVMSLG